jgi:GNAT superfamily N-acetyltransferase
LEKHQAESLRRLRDYAHARSPFYQRFHRGLTDRPLQELPVLTKALVMENFDELVTEGFLHSYQGKGVFVADEFPGQGQGAALRSLLAGVLQSARDWGMSPEEMALALIAHGGLARQPEAAPHRLLLVGGSRPQLRRLQSQLEAALPAVVVPMLTDEVEQRSRGANYANVACTLFHAAEVQFTSKPSG